MGVWFPFGVAFLTAIGGILLLRHRKSVASFIVDRNRKLYGVNLNASRVPKSMTVVGCAFLAISLAMFVVTVMSLFP